MQIAKTESMLPTIVASIESGDMNDIDIPAVRRIAAIIVGITLNLVVVV